MQQNGNFSNMTDKAILQNAYKADWQKISASDYQKITRSFESKDNSLDEFKELLSELSLYQCTLSFYPNWRLIAVLNDKGYGPLARFALITEETENPILLDWTQPPVMEINDLAPIQLQKETVLEYAKFFLSFVRGPHGRFKIVESGRDMPWKRGIKGNKKALAIKSMLSPEITEIASGTYEIRASILFKDILAHATLTVSENGDIAMGPPSIKIDALPIEPEQFLF